MSRALPRAALVLLAVVVLGWLAVMYHDTRMQSAGVAMAGTHTPASLARAARELRGARLLNPDTQPDLLRAFVLRSAGRPLRAQAVVEDVLRREPDDLMAWGALAALVKDRDPAALRRALAARRRLDPLNAR